MRLSEVLPVRYTTREQTGFEAKERQGQTPREDGGKQGFCSTVAPLSRFLERALYKYPEWMNGEVTDCTQLIDIWPNY